MKIKFKMGHSILNQQMGVATPFFWSSWSISIVQSEFNVSQYLARQSRNLVKKNGILPQNKENRTRNKLDEVSVKTVQDIYEKDEYSRMMPRKRDCVSVRGPNGEKESFRTVRISLAQRDLRKTVLSILKTCDLPTSYVDNIEPPPPQEKPTYFRNKQFDENDPIYGSVVLKDKMKKAKDAEKLTLASEECGEALSKLAAHQPVRDEILKLQKTLCESLGIQSVVWDCDWNVTHFRGCLMSFQALARHHPNLMHSLHGRKLIFANDTGVNLDGHVMLNSGEVRHNWLDLIKNVDKQDAVLFRIPSFERAVSRVLRDIKVVRRKFQPKVMAKHYENQLRRLTTSLSDHQGRMGYPKDWPSSLSDFELVVETEAGPLMLSPTGQFIVPSSCPAFLLVTFMSQNLDEAARLLVRYPSNKHIERDLHERCITEFQLAALQKDDNITPDLMIECCNRLLTHKNELYPSLRGVHLWVTNYYSVLSDGEVCVPWNWKL